MCTGSIKQITKLEGVADKLKGRLAIWNDLNLLKKWANKIS